VKLLGTPSIQQARPPTVCGGRLRFRSGPVRERRLEGSITSPPEPEKPGGTGESIHLRGGTKHRWLVQRVRWRKYCWRIIPRRRVGWLKPAPRRAIRRGGLKVGPDGRSGPLIRGPWFFSSESLLMTSQNIAEEPGRPDRWDRAGPSLWGAAEQSTDRSSCRDQRELDASCPRADEASEVGQIRLFFYRRTVRGTSRASVGDPVRAAFWNAGFLGHFLHSEPRIDWFFPVLPKRLERAKNVVRGNSCERPTRTPLAKALCGRQALALAGASNFNLFLLAPRND